MTKSIEWLKRSDSPAVRLICFPYAGSGPSVFRSWVKLVPHDCDLLAVSLPGREKRLNEPYCESVNDVLSDLSGIEELVFDLPFMVFGHSMGALIAFEFVRKLQSEKLSLPKLFVASGCVAPQEIHKRRKISSLCDAEFLKQLRSYQGTPESIFKDQELLKIFTPRLRADMKILDDYMFISGKKINCPILGMYGDDDQYVPDHLFSSWKELTQEAFFAREFSGGHFYINELRNQVINNIFEFEKKLIAGV